MPIFEFDCADCRERFERLVPCSSDLSEVSCPKCSSKNVRKLVSAFGIGGGSSKLKGGGSGCHSCSSKNCSTCR